MQYLLDKLPGTQVALVGLLQRGPGAYQYTQPNNYSAALTAVNEHFRCGRLFKGPCSRGQMAWVGFGGVGWRWMRGVQCMWLAPVDVLCDTCHSEHPPAPLLALTTLAAAPVRPLMNPDSCCCAALRSDTGRWRAGTTTSATSTATCRPPCC